MEDQKEMKIIIWAMAAVGEGISGGDRIFIEFARRWSKQYPVTIYLWEEGYRMCLRHKLQISNVKFQISSMEPWSRFGFIVNYFARVAEGLRLGLTVKIENPKETIIYSASDFWMDSLPAFVLKIRYPKIRWVAAWYQTAPKPWVGFTEEKRENRYYFTAFIYWLMQFPVKPLVGKFADLVLVNNENEKMYFPKKAKVVLGAVNINEIEKWKLKFKELPKIFDGVFQGRFHPQKGVEELVDIWRIVVNRKPGAKLVMMGDGPLMEGVKRKVKSLKLENNIILTGYLFDGEEKYKIFAQSKIVVHPAFFDSGGMASAEAMAFGLPCVGFNLKSYKSYYPQGMIKVPAGDLKSFAEEILKLLSNNNLYTKIAKESSSMIDKSWSWDKRASDTLNFMIE